MRKKRDEFCTNSIMLLLGILVLLMIAGFVAPTYAASANTSDTGRLATTKVISVFDPFLLRTVMFMPKVVSVSTMRVARVSVNNGNSGSNGNGPTVLVPGRRSVRSCWMPGDGPPPPIVPPGT